MFAAVRLSESIDGIAYVISSILFIIAAVIGAVWLIAAAGTRKVADCIQTADPQYEKRLQESAPVTGRVTQIRENRARIPGKTAFHDYHVAIAYNRDGKALTALFGLTADQPLALTEGSRVKLRLFQYPLMRTTQEAWHRAESVCGFLPDGSVEYRSIRGISVDETATVMFEEDYPAFAQAEHSAYTAQDHTTVPNVIRVLAVIFALVGLSVLAGLFRLFAG